MAYHSITKDLYRHRHDYFPSLPQHSPILMIKHRLHLACVEVCEQKFQIVHLSACTIALNMPQQTAVTKQWSYVGVWLCFKITHQFCGFYNVSLLVCPWGWQLSWDVLADAVFLSDKSATLRAQQRDTLYFQIICWGSLSESFIQSINIFLSGSFFQERLHHQARIPYEGPRSWFGQNVREYWLKILQTALLLLKVMCSDFVSLTFRRRIKSRLPFAGIIRSSPYSPRFQDKG